MFRFWVPVLFLLGIGIAIGYLPFWLSPIIVLAMLLYYLKKRRMSTGDTIRLTILACITIGVAGAMVYRYYISHLF
jgi:hypothetical protein